MCYEFEPVGRSTSFCLCAGWGVLKGWATDISQLPLSFSQRDIFFFFFLKIMRRLKRTSAGVIVVRHTALLPFTRRVWFNSINSKG